MSPSIPARNKLTSAKYLLLLLPWSCMYPMEYMKISREIREENISITHVSPST